MRISDWSSDVCSSDLLGVLLYDADRIEQAAAVQDEKDLYEAQLGVFLDPEDPAVVAQALADGVPQGWLDAARHSPTYKMAVQWRIAFPLHPEYRTLPMVWYVPRSEEHTSELQSLMRISYAVFCLQKKNT